jgi:hypothetical protein
MRVLLLFLVGLVYGQEVAIRSIAVKGTLKCGDKQAENVLIKLYRVNNQDTTTSVEERQLLDTRTTGPSGMFEINGNTNGRPINETTIDPVIRIFHRCDVPDDKVCLEDGGLDKCFRKRIALDHSKS